MGILRLMNCDYVDKRVECNVESDTGSLPPAVPRLAGDLQDEEAHLLQEA